MKKTIAIIGAGASGMAAAIAAARAAERNSAEVEIVLLERMPRVGKKILSTGNGRCNLSNALILPEHYHSQNPRELEEAVAGSSAEEVIEFFEKAGLMCERGDGGRIYPLCNQASMVLDILLRELERYGVSAECGFEACCAKKAGSRFDITASDGRKISADAVIFAAGGKASPSLGSDGSGFELLKKFGHTLAPLYPCLVPVKADSGFVKALKGIKTTCRATLCKSGRALASEVGEILFTDYGLSGIPIMQLSCLMSDRMADAAYSVELDLLPKSRTEELEARIAKHRSLYPNEILEQLLLGTINKKLGFMVLKSAGIYPLSRRVGELSDIEITAIARALKSLGFELSGTLSWNQAQVTGGGILLREVDTRTMQSKKMSGAYICGELLDIAGDCGGYNLHWAWLSGMRAGTAAAESLLESVR
ncbi:MAG: aminoacetone oxidase family FAD-binding enzyme [Oscillospiraceae bacterium]